jgi:hypothetical protein
VRHEPTSRVPARTLGYDVSDYAPGKVDWMAHGLPVEGTAAERPTALSLARDDVATAALDDPVDEIAQRIDASP